MWIEAILTRDDLADVLAQLTPLKVVLGEASDGRALFLGRPRTVELVPDVGLRVECRARVAWRLAGVKLPLTLHRVTAMLRPRIGRREGEPERDVLLLSVRLQELDVGALPAFADARVRARVNETLRGVDHVLAWDFLSTLSFGAPLPGSLATTERIDLRATWGEVRVAEEALVLAVAFRTHLTRRHPRAA